MATIDIELGKSGGKNLSLADFKGKVVLVVNIASRCGFSRQLSELEKLYQQYKDQGFVVLAFPSNDFKQEPLSSEAIQAHCALNYGVSFPVFELCHVGGSGQHDLFRYLAGRKRSGDFSVRPLWNFQKYLLDKNGKLVEFFFPFTTPLANRLTRRIEKLL